VDRYQTGVMKGLVGADYWFDENGVVVSANAALGAHHEALKATIIRARQYAAQQDARLAPAVVTRADQKDLCRHITTEMRDIAQIARRLRGTVPGIGALVAPSNRLGTLAFLSGAAGFMDKATNYAQALIEQGMSPDFVASIRAELKQFEDVVAARRAARSNQVSATESLHRELKAGLAIVDVADVCVKRALRDKDPGKLAGWLSASHKDRPSGSRAAQAPVTPPTTEAS